MSLPDGSSPHNTLRRFSSSASNPFSAADVYYADRSRVARHDQKNRTFSAVFDGSGDPALTDVKPERRRGSVDALGSQPRKFLLPVEATLRELLSREDTDSNTQITIDDDGPKASTLPPSQYPRVISVGTAGSLGYKRAEIRGTYMLSNLLQELTLAQDYGRRVIELDEARLSENPVDRLSRMIRDSFWKNLTRAIDGDNIAFVAKDPKDWTDDPRPRVYVPPGAPEQYEYYTRIAKKHPEIRLDVRWLSPNVTAEYIRDLNDAPGLLAIDMEEFTNSKGEKDLRGKPFVVPGGRFNELYGWDSYMISLGLVSDTRDKVELAKNMVENFCFCIKHYGKILNANRSYYLGRSQPPFLTDMTLRVYGVIKHEPYAIDFLRRGILAAIKEYYSVWMADPRYDPDSGLSRYRPIGVGVPPETEASHFVHVLEPYAAKHGLSFKEFVYKYNHGVIKEPELDTYFLHDRAVRESGHDTSYRLENLAADLATVDLNSCLYKIETDIARTIKACFSDRLEIPPEFQAPGGAPVEVASVWERRSKKRRAAMDKYMWNEEEGMYFDYNTAKKAQTGYESATTFWAMWAGVPVPRKAAAMVTKALPKFEELGGLAAGTEQSRGEVGLHRPNRQWDYPFGWAPQQMLAWVGLQRYGYEEEAQRLAYKWLFMVTKAFVDFNGVVVEKYDVTQPDHPHLVAAEYGNQGSDFKGVPREGFGWVNSSYVYGLSLVDSHMRRALGTLTPWETFDRATQEFGVYTAAREESDDMVPQESEHLSYTSRTREGLVQEPASHEAKTGNGNVGTASHGLGDLKHSHAGSAHHAEHVKQQEEDAALIRAKSEAIARQHGTHVPNKA